MLSERGLSIFGVMLAWPLFSFLAAAMVSQPLGHAAIAIWMPAMWFGIVAGVIHGAALMSHDATRSTSLTAAFLVALPAAVTSYFALCFYLNQPLLIFQDHIAMVIAICGIAMPGLVFLGAIRPLSKTLLQRGSS